MFFSCPPCMPRRPPEEVEVVPARLQELPPPLPLPPASASPSSLPASVSSARGLTGRAMLPALKLGTGRRKLSCKTMSTVRVPTPDMSRVVGELLRAGVSPEKLTVAYLVNKFPTFHGTLRSIALFIKATNWYLW